MKKNFCPGWDLNSRPSRSVNQQVFMNLLLQIGIILTAYEVNFNHQYLFIFSVDFHVFGHCSISIPHRSQKDPLYALAYFLVYFSWFSAVCIAWAILWEYMHKKFEINRTKIKGSCQLGRKVVTHNSKSDLTLVEIVLCISNLSLCIGHTNALNVRTDMSVGVMSIVTCKIFTLKAIARGKSLLELWVTTFLPNWQLPLIIVWYRYLKLLLHVL